MEKHNTKSLEEKPDFEELRQYLINQIERAKKTEINNDVKTNTPIDDLQIASFCRGKQIGYSDSLSQFEKIWHKHTQQVEELTREKDKLQKFKDYVHDRLDKMGVPVDPESEHKAAGCRIGGRLDYVQSLKSELEELKKERDTAFNDCASLTEKLDLANTIIRSLRKVDTINKMQIIISNYLNDPDIFKPAALNSPAKQGD